MSDDILNGILGIGVPDQEQTTNIITLDPTEEDTSIIKVPEQEPSAITVRSVPVEEKMETDFEFARDKMRDIIKKGQEATDSAIMLAQSGDEPRAYEVVGGMITAIIQANKELINIHHIKAKKEAVQNTYGTRAPQVVDEKGNVTIEKAVFIGKASDLLREIRALAKPITEVSPGTQPETTDTE